MGYVEDSAGIPFTYFRFVAKGLQETESPDTRSFSFAIDDIRYYRNAAVSDPDSIHVYQDITYNISENSGFSIEESGLRVQENTTWGELKSSLEVADGVSYKLYDSKITAAKTLTDTDTLDEGDVLVFTEEGNRKIEYLTIVDNVLTDENFNNQADSLPAVVTNAEGVSAAHGYESGLYANADETDFARVGTINITTEHTRNDYWWWIDAIYMALPFYTQMGVTYNDDRCFEKAHRLFTNIKTERACYDETEHLWYRDERFLPDRERTREGKKLFWSRGNGWVFAGLARALHDMPKEHRYYEEYKTVFVDMAVALLKCQQDNGGFTTSLYAPEDFPACETSGTALFTLGFLMGVHMDLLDTSYPKKIGSVEMRGRSMDGNTK